MMSTQSFLILETCVICTLDQSNYWFNNCRDLFFSKNQFFLVSLIFLYFLFSISLNFTLVIISFLLFTLSSNYSFFPRFTKMEAEVIDF